MKWHLEKRLLKELTPHPKNPRRLSKLQSKHLQQSIDSFGMIDKPIINTDGMIIGGHQRVALLKKTKNCKDIDCWVPDSPLTEKQCDELNIRLNRNNGEFDWDILGNDWNLEELIEWGFEEKDIMLPEEVETKPKKNKTESKTICPECGHEFE